MPPAAAASINSMAATIRMLLKGLSFSGASVVGVAGSVTFFEALSLVRGAGFCASAGGVAVSTGGVALSTGGVASSAGGVAVSTGGVALSTGGVALSTGGVALSTGAGLLAAMGVSSGEVSIFLGRLAVTLEGALADRALCGFSG